MPRNLTNTFENVSNRNITNTIITNSLKATLPLELTDDGTDNIISLKGLSTIGNASQIIRVNAAATGLEYHTLEVVDLNSTQTLTNKTLSTGCNFTGNRIGKAHLDTTLVDTTTAQVVENKTLRSCSLNYNNNQLTLIGSINNQTYIDGTLNINQNGSRGVIRFANDDNNSIYLRQNLLNANCMAFYSFSDIFFYTGNNTNLNQAQYPLRMAITHTAISMLVNTIINGTLNVSSTLSSGDLTATSLSSKTVNVFKNNDNGLVEIFKSTVDNGNNNGTAKLHFTIDSINTSAGSSTITNVAQMGIFDNTTIFRIKNLVNDIEITAGTNINLKRNNNTPINLNFFEGNNFTTLVCNNTLTSDNIVKLPTSAGTLAILADIPNINATSPMVFSNDNISIGGLTGFGSANQVIQVNSSGNGFVYGNLPNFSTLILSATDISTSSILFNPATNIGNSSRNVNITSALMFLNANGANIKFLNNNVEKMAISATVVLVKNKQLITNSGTSIVSDSQLQVNNSAQSKLLISSESADCLLAFQTINSSTTYTASIFFRNSSRILELTNFTKIRPTNVPLELNRNIDFYEESSTEYTTAKKRGHMFVGNTSDICLCSENVHLRLHSGITQGQVPAIGSGTFQIQFFTETISRGYIDSTGLVLKSPDGTKSALIQQTNTDFNITQSQTQQFNIQANIIALRTIQSGSLQTQLSMSSGSLVILNTNLFQLAGNGGFNFDPTRTSGNSTFGNSNYTGGFSFTTTSGSMQIASRFRKQIESETNKNEYYYNIDNTAFDTANLRGQIFPGNNNDWAILTHSVHLRLHAGNTIGQTGLNANNVAIQFFVSNAERGFMTSSQFTLFVRQDMSRNAITFRDAGDMNHSIIFNNPIDGLLIKGFERVRVDTRYGTAFEAKNDGTTPKLCIPFGTSCNSDDRIKFNETPITNAINTIKKLNPVFYNKASVLDYTGDTHKLPTEYGFIAQDVYNNVPELRNSVNFDKTLKRNFVNEDLDGNCVEDIYNEYVNDDGDTITERDICGFSYDNLHAISIKAIQELLSEVELLKNRIQVLESLIS